MKGSLRLIIVLAALLQASVSVLAQTTDATRSVASGSGLQSSQAGVVSSFAITAKDESGASRTSGGDTFIVELEGTRSITASVIDQLSGVYIVTYTATKSGAYECSVMLAQSGGLSAEYYENVWFFYTPVRQSVDPQINFNWGTGLLTASAADYVSIRWTGKIKTQFAEVYTFFATTDDGARLWVDNSPLLDRWDSFTNDTSATISLKANVFYNIKMEFKEVVGTAYCMLSWASASTPKEIIPASQLYYQTHINQSPFVLSVAPYGACASTSASAGGGLAVATAGTAAQFTIQANDQYDNELGVGGSFFSVRIHPPSGSSSPRPQQAVVVDNTDSSYSVEYTAFISGTNTLYSQYLYQVGGGGGVFVQNMDDTFTRSIAGITGQVSTVSSINCAAVTGGSVRVNSDPCFTLDLGFDKAQRLRFATLLKPPADGVFTFSIDHVCQDTHSCPANGIKLSVDSITLISVTPTTTPTTSSGTISLRSVNYYDVFVDWSLPLTTSQSLRAKNGLILKWEWSTGTSSVVPGTALYKGFHTLGSPFSVSVNPARTSAATTIATDAAGARSLSIATAGLQAVFTITAKDLYRNLRGVGGESFKVRLTGVDSTAGVVTDRGDGLYAVSYTATKSGTYDISVVIGAGGISGSPFRLYVQPAARHMSNSIATGASLTLATAGIQAVLTLTVKDRFDNWQPSNSVVSTASLKFFLTPQVQIVTVPPSCVTTQPPSGDCPNFVDTTNKLAATPTSLDKATVTLRYTVTKSGVYQLVLRGESKFDGPVNNSPFPLTVFPHLPCASTSTAAGTALTLVTAGIAATFTIQSKDMNYNLRGSQVGDNFVSFVRQHLVTNIDVYNHGSDYSFASGNSLVDHPATLVDQGDSTYIASFVATKSVTNSLWSVLGYRGSIMATYYSASPSTTMGVQFTSVEFTCANGVSGCPAAGIADAAPFNVRFQGLFRPTRTGKLHFMMTMNDASQSMIFMMNNKLIISATATGADHVASSSTAVSVVSNQFYHIFISFSHSGNTLSSNRRFKLQYSYNPTTEGGSTVPTLAAHYQTIESTALFLAVHSAGSPFSLNVRPTVACATLSTISNMAISLSTAGYPALFTMQTRDEFNNQGETSGDPYDYALMQGSTLPVGSASQDDSKDGGTLKFQGTLSYKSGGGYNLRYTATLRGTYGLRGKILQSGGLFGTYFENDDLTDHGQLANNPDVAASLSSFQRIDSTIDFVWGTNRPVDPASAEFQPYISNGGQLKRIGPDYFSVRWTGLIQPKFTEVFTFSVEVDDGIRLWIDDLLIINFWSLKSAVVDGTIALMKDTMYPIKLEYRDVQGNATIRLFWRSGSQQMQIVPSSRLYHATTAAKLSQPQLFVQPSVLCASQSSAVGPGLTLGTAGAMSYFTIQSRDEYGNNRVLGDAPYLTVRIVPIAEVRRPYHVNLNELKTGSTLNSGITRIAGNGEYPGGLTATYYGDGSSDFVVFHNTAKVSCMAQPWQNEAQAFCGGPKIVGTRISGLATATASKFTVRFKGNFLPTVSASYRFFLHRIGDATSTAGLNVDGIAKIVIGAGGSIDNAVHYADISMVTGNFYDMEVLYKSTNTGTHPQAQDFELKYCPNQCSLHTDALSIPSSNLFPIAGRYKTYYTPTVKGDYSISAAVALPGGLDATFYDDLSLSSPIANAVSQTIDFSTTPFRDVSDGLPRTSDQIGFGTNLKLSDRNSFSARWQGFLQVVTANTVTMTVGTNSSDERVRLWVDNVLLIDQWDSYQTITATSFSATFSLAYSEQTGVQLSDANSYFDLRLEYKQFSGDAAIKLLFEYGSGSAIIPSTALFLKRDILGSPFPPFAVLAASTCSTASTVRGSALTSSTAGVASSFTIQSNDRYHNERGMGGDVYVVRLSAACSSGCSCAAATCPVVFGSVVDMGDSSYVATYNATRRGNYMVHTSLAEIGKLSVAQGAINDGPQILAASKYITSAASTAITFSGFVMPPTAGVYTFSASLGTTTHFSFTPQLSSISGASNIRQFAASNVLYDISFIWTSPSSSPLEMELRWAYGGNSAAVVPTDRFFSRMDVHPMSGTCVLAGCAENYPIMTLNVENTDPAVSIASGNGLTLTTAGWTASFTITAKDSFANERKLVEDVWSVLLVGSGKEAVLAANSIQNSGDIARYQVTYTITQSGIFSVNILRGIAEGLKAEYFNNMWLLGSPAATVIDYSTDYNWESGVVKPSNGANDVILGSDYMSVRWSGLFRIDPDQFSGTLTFSTETDEGVRLYVNNTLLIDGWDSVGVNFTATWPATGIDAVRNGMYSVKFEYRESTGPAFCRLFLSSNSFPKIPLSNFTSVLYSEGQHIFGSPFVLYSFPAITCAASSSTFGPGLSFGTTGNIASFVIQAKDEYSNMKTAWSDPATEEIFVVRSQSFRSASNTDASKVGTVTHNIVNGRFNALYTATKTGATSVYVSMVDLRSGNIGAGLLATYYYARSNAEPLLPVYLVARQSNDIINRYGKIGTNPGISYFDGVPNPTSGSVYTAKITGLFKPTSSGVYTFQLNNCAAGPLIQSSSLYVSNLKVFEVAGTVANPGTRSGTVYFPSPLRYYDISIDFQFFSSSVVPAFENAFYGAGACSLQFETAAAGLSDLGNNVFKELAVGNSPYRFVEAPDVTLWDRSIIKSESLTIATAGVPSQFTIQSRDKNNNNRISGGDIYVIQGASATGAAFSGSVADNMDGTYTVVYTPSVQGAYILKHFLGEADKTTSLTVQPGATCASASNSNSNYLSIATAGFQSWFTLQAKDQYKNLRTIGDNNFILRLTGPQLEEHNLKASYVGGNLVHQLGKFATQYRTSRSGSFAINVLLAETQGLNATYYRDPNTQSQVLTRIDSQVSFNWGSGTPDPQVGVTDSFSVSWKGFVKAPATGRFTFAVATDGADERIQLWVDNRFIIDSWTNTHALVMEATIMLNANVLYDIKMRYNDLSGKASVYLRWKYSNDFATIPSDHLFAASSHIMGSPFSAYVYPALTCGSSSTVRGDGVSLATAGIPASFTIIAKDHLGNMRTTADDIFVVRARPLTSLNIMNHPQAYVARNILGTVTALGNGLYAAVVTPTKKAHALSQSSVLASPGFGGGEKRPWHDVLVSLAKPGGLYATFYGPNNFVGSSQHMLLADSAIATPASSNSFRFSGFFRPTVSTMYTFVISTPGTGNTLKIHIDGKQVVDSTSILSGTMQFFSINALYDMYIEAGSGSNAIPSSMSLKYICCGDSDKFIPSDRLFQSQDLTHKTHEFQGLFATYYFHGGVPAVCTSSPWTKPDPGSTCVVHVLDSTIDWSGVSLTDRPNPDVVPSGDFSARWVGFVRPSRRDRYTFFVHTRTASSGYVKLSVDNVEIIGVGQAGTQLGSSGIYEFSGTIQFPSENDVYDITLHYHQASIADRKVALLWENTGATYSKYGVVVPVTDWVNKSIISSDRLSKIRSQPIVLRDDSSWWSFPASPCLGTSENELEYRECRGIGVSLNDILHVDVKPNVACASTSLIVRNDVAYNGYFSSSNPPPHFVAGLHGPMVTLTTAGSVRSFDIVIRDEYFNVRNGRDEAIMARQYLTSDYGSEITQSSTLFHGTISFQPFSASFNPLALNLQHDPEGHYTATYMVTVAGDFQQEVSIAGNAGNGIAGTYFIGANLSGGSVNRVESAFDFNWGNSTPTTDSNLWGSLWSARFTGFIKVPNFEVVTFTSVHEGVVELWVNSVPVLQQSSVAGTTSSGTVLLSANVLYDIRLEFSKTASNAQLQLRYSSASIPFSVIPSSVLFPYKRIIGNGLLPLNAEHSIICATTSRVTGSGLTIATTGIPAFFTIQARDEYQNLRIHQNAGQSGCTGFFCQDCSSLSDCLLSSTLVLDSPANKDYLKRQRIATITPHVSASSSLFSMTYTYTKAGTHTVQTSYMKPGGLMATYYDDSAFALPRRAVQEIPVQNPWTRQSIVNDQLFCVRWAGSVRVPSSVNPTTFVVNALVGDQYRLYVDEALIIDKWTITATNIAATTSGIIKLNSAAADFYNVLLEYKSHVSNSNNVIDLRFGGSSINSATTSNLYRRDHISGTSKRLRINPNVACAVTSTHRGVGLTLATAGLQAVFTITSIDAYGNQRGVGGDTFVVRAFPLGLSTGMIFPPLGNGDATAPGPFTFSSCTSCCLGCPSLVRASVIDRKDNTYLVSYTPTKKGDYKMISSLARFGGLTATVYSATYNPASPTIFGTPGLSILENNVVDFSVAASDPLPTPLSQTTGTWRWQGFIQPSKAAQYTFYVAVKHTSEGCKVWIDNNLVITYLGSGTDVSATFGFGLANSLYDIDVIYYASSGAQQRGISLMWESLGSTNAASNVVKAVIPSSALWSRHDVENMDIPNGDSSATAKNWMFTPLIDSVERKLFVQPAIGCASMSTAVGNALTLATAGQPATFTIFSKDMWQNSRSIQSDMVWVGTAFGSGGVPTVLAAVTNIRSSTVTAIASGEFTTLADHGLAIGDSIMFSVPNFVTHKLPTELSPNTYYYVLTVPTSTTFTIATTKGGTAVTSVTFTTQFFLETNAYRVSYTINSAKQFSFFAKSSNYNAMNSPFSLTVVPHRQCGTQSTVFGSGISSAMFDSVTAFTIVARDFYGNRRTIANDGAASPDDVYLASVVYSSVPSAAPWSFKSDGSVDTFTAAAASAFGAGPATTTYIVQATTISGTGSGAIFKIEINSGGTIMSPTLLVGGYGYALNSQMKMFKENYGSNAMGDITITVTAVKPALGLDAVMVTSPCEPPFSPCNNLVPTNVGNSDGTYTGAYTLKTMPPGAAYAGAFFRAFLGVKGGLMATFYSAASNPSTSSLDLAPYVRAETRLVNHASSDFLCANCFAGARFHGFLKITACGSIAIQSGLTRTYISGQIKHNAWDTASALTVDGNCANGKYVEIYQESRAASASSSHAITSLLKLDTSQSPLETSNLYAAFAISNTPVPLTVTK